MRKYLVHLIAILMLAIPCGYAAISNISGFTTRADGNTITASIWNSEIGGIYTYINANLVAALNTLTTKGDIFAHDGSALARLPVGTNGQILTANSAKTTGLEWGTVASTTTLTTKGDILGHTGSALARVAAGTDGYVLTSRSSDANGVAWEAPVTIPTGTIVMWSGSIASIPSGWHLCDGTAGTPNLQGLFVVGAGNVSPAATGGMGLVSPGGPAGDTAAGTGLGPAHTHSLPGTGLGYEGGFASTTALSSTTSGSATITPRYYALAFIYKT